MIPALEQVVNFTLARHQVLTANIANLDTPDYDVRDFSVKTFQRHLQEAIVARHQQRQEAMSGVVTDGQDDALYCSEESKKQILLYDGRDVGLEQQITEITKKQMMHNIAVTIMNNQFELLEAVISERV